MIGYIPMIHWEYDGEEPAESPTRLYWSYEEAAHLAEGFAVEHSGTHAAVLEVEVPQPLIEVG